MLIGATPRAALTTCASNDTPIPDSLFQRWLQHNVPVSFKAIRGPSRLQKAAGHLSFWTTAPITNLSFTLYEKVKDELDENRYKIELRGPGAVTKIFFDTFDPSLITAFGKHLMLDDGTIPPIARAPKPPAVAEEVSDDFWL